MSSTAVTQRQEILSESRTVLEHKLHVSMVFDKIKSMFHQIIHIL